MTSQSTFAFSLGGSGSFDPEPGRWPSGRRFVPHRTSEPRMVPFYSKVCVAVLTAVLAFAAYPPVAC